MLQLSVAANPVFIPFFTDAAVPHAGPTLHILDSIYFTELAGEVTVLMQLTLSSTPMSTVLSAT